MAASLPVVSEKDDDKKQSDKDSENEKDDQKEAIDQRSVKTDSSVHSISKYNFLFYMVYKVKYGEVNERGETQAIAEE